MVRKLHWFWFVRGDHNEGRYWLGRVLAMPDAPLHAGLYAEILTQLAHHTWLVVGTKESRLPVEQALAIARAHDDKRNTARALSVLGLVLTRERNFSAAQSTIEESEALFQEVDDKWGYAHAVMCLALGYLIQDDFVTALALHEQAFSIFREVGDRYFQAVGLRHIGNIQVKQSDWINGIKTLREALTLARQMDSKFEIYAATWSFTEAAQRAGDPARTVRLGWAAKNIADAIGAWWREDDEEFEAILTTCRAALSELEFTEAVEQGRAMTMEQAIAYALGNSDE